MALPGTPGDAIETLYVDLAFRTEKLEKTLKDALSNSAKQIKDGLEAPVDSAQKKIIGMGDVVKSVFQSMFSTFVQTRDPLATLTTGIQSANVAIQASAASGSEAAASFAGIAGSVAGLVTILVALLALATPVLDFIKQMATQGIEVASRIDSLKIALTTTAKNIGENIDFVNLKLSQLQKNGITTQEAMNSLSQFMSQGLPIDNIEKLARAGQDMAVAFGKNSSETFQRFTYAVMTGSSEVLRMVGIQKTASQMQEEYAKTVGKSANELTDLEKKQAIVNGIIQYATSYTGLYENSLDSVGKKMSSLQRYTEEAALAFGDTLLPVQKGIVDAQTLLMKSFESLFVVMKDGHIQLDRFENPTYTKFGQIIHDAAIQVEYMIGKVVSFIPAIVNAIKQTTDWVGDRTSGLMGIYSVGKAVVDTIVAITQALIDIAVQIAKVNGIVLDFPMAFALIGAAWKTFVTGFAIGAGTIVGLLTLIKESAEAVSDTISGKVAKSADQIIKDAQMAGVQTALLITGDAKQAIAPTDTRKEDIAEMHDDINSLNQAGKEVDQNYLDLLNKLAMEGRKIIEAGNEQIANLKTAFEERMKNFNDSVVEAQKKLSENLEKARQDIFKQAVKAKSKIDSDYADAQASLTKSANQTREDAEKTYQDNEIRAKEDFLHQMKQMDENYLMSLEDAVQNRDAITVLKLMRQNALNKKQAKDNYDYNRSKAAEDHSKQMEDINQQEKDKQKSLKDSYEQKLRDLNDSVAEQLETLQENYRDQMKELLDNATKQRNQMKTEYDKQLADLKTANKKRLTEMLQNWADQKTVTSDGAKKVLDVLKKMYGIDGSVDDLLKDFLERLRANGSITISVTNEVNPPSSGGGSGGGGGAGNGQPRDHPNASGSLMIASRPTKATFGEAGKEAAFFLPLNDGRMSLNQLFGALAQGNSGGSNGGSQTIEHKIDINAQGNFSPEFEDRLYGTIADAIVAASPGLNKSINKVSRE